MVPYKDETAVKRTKSSGKLVTLVNLSCCRPFDHIFMQTFGKHIQPDYLYYYIIKLLQGFFIESVYVMFDLFLSKYTDK